MTVVIEVDISEMLPNAVVGEDVRSVDQISKTLSGSGVFESGSLLGGGDGAERRAELEGQCSVWGDEYRGISPRCTPSPESPDQLMTCVKAACDLGHRGQKYCNDWI